MLGSNSLVEFRQKEMFVKIRFTYLPYAITDFSLIYRAKNQQRVR